MKRSFRIIPFILPVLYFIVSCISPTNHSQEFERWTSSDPLAINFRARHQKYAEGNLIFNPSFELGRIKYLDSLTYNTNIDGWSLIGDHVKWLHPGTDSQAIDSLQVFSGKSAIRIHRVKTHETDEFGEGVLSDYIKVIPGNYRLRLHVNLKDIKNPRSRLGMRLYDAVDIKIVHYDKNKLKISGDFEAPYYQTIIDNSFKSLSLANLTGIDSTGWLHITGKSHIFPFPDGDLQDETKYVRVFIGLKGTGTLWVDDVNLEYTRWNFTMKERLEPFYDSTIAKNNLIIPQPKDIEILESQVYYQPYYKNRFPLILIPENTESVTKQAAVKLEHRIKTLLSQLSDLEMSDIPGLIKTSLTEEELATSLIFSLGNTNLAKQFSELLPYEKIEDYNRGFLVHSFEEKNNLIFLIGNKPVGNLYAVQVVQQLFDDQKLLFHNANITDYPTWDGNGLLLLNYSARSKDLLVNSDQLRFSELYLPGKSPLLEETLKDENLTDNFGVNLYFQQDDWAIEPTKTLQHFKQLAWQYNAISGISFLNFPHENSLKPQKICSTEGHSKPDEQMNYVLAADELDAIKKEYAVSIMPYYSDNVSLISGLNYPVEFSNSIASVKNLPVLWSGNFMQTWRLDEGDYLLYKHHFNNTLNFLDFTLYPRSKTLDYFATDSVWPYKLQTASLFEPFANEVLYEVYEQAEKTILVFEVNSVFDRIRFRTASDFFWNPISYDPDLSVYRALLAEFGEKTAQLLISFNDVYFKSRKELLLANDLKNRNKHIRRANVLYRELELIKNQLLQANSSEEAKELEIIVSNLVDEISGKIEHFTNNPAMN